jgi:hypothetical protein
VQRQRRIDATDQEQSKLARQHPKQTVKTVPRLALMQPMKVVEHQTRRVGLPVDELDQIGDGLPFKAGQLSLAVCGERDRIAAECSAQSGPQHTWSVVVFVEIDPCGRTGRGVGSPPLRPLGQQRRLAESRWRAHQRYRRFGSMHSRGFRPCHEKFPQMRAPDVAARELWHLNLRSRHGCTTTNPFPRHSS